MSDRSATSVFLSSKPQLFSLRMGPPTTAWPHRHAEEDFLALVRHNAATMLEMEQWPPVLKKRRVGKPSLHDQYTQALCDWVATLEDLPQAKRPGWWRHGMSLFGEKSAPPDGAETDTTLELAKLKRAYHQPSRDLAGELRAATPHARMGQQDDRGPSGGMAAARLPTFVDAETAASTNNNLAWWCHGMSLFGERSAPLDGAGCIATLELVKPKRAYHQSSRELQNWVVDCALLRLTRTLRRCGWKRTRRKGARSEMLAMCSFPSFERSATVLAGQASRLPRL